METNLTIEKLVYGGAGLARREGKVVLVPFVLPGEEIRAEIQSDKPQMSEARLLEVLQPAPDRAAPPCPVFAQCGGCHYQHAAYALQLEQKRAILRESIQRTGRFEAPAEIDIISGEPLHYRNRIQVHFQGGRAGFHAAGSRKLVATKSCAIASPALDAALHALSELRHHPRFPKFIESLELFSNEETTLVNVLESGQGVSRHFFEWLEEKIPGASRGELEYPAAGFLFRVNHRSFFQVNRFLVEPLIEVALAGAEGETAADLYAGVGLFSLPLARRFPRVTAVEVTRSAAADLEHNAARAGLALENHQQTAEAFLANAKSAPDFVLADPPRAGLGKEIVAALLRLLPPRIHIVSCDPATLARDLAALRTAYDIESMTLVDLFPQTYHLETVTKLRRR